MPRETCFNSKEIRKTILTMAYKAQCGHLGPALSIVDILVDIFNKMGPNDKLILSKGHGAMALYACLYHQGLISSETINDYLKDGSDLHALSEQEFATGSLGHGLPIAAGMAYGRKKRGKPGKIYCVVGDGEMQEGSCAEALNFASHHELNNLKVIVDSNGLQAMGKTLQILKFISYEEHGPVEIRYTKKGDGVSFMEDDNEWHYKRLTPELYEQAMREQK